MIQLKRVYEPASERDGFRVLVDRMWPRGISKAEAAVDCWLKEIAPCAELRKWFGHAPERWSAFCERYTAELDDNQEAVGFLKEKSGGTLTLVFAARDVEHNNAVVLKRYLQSH